MNKTFLLLTAIALLSITACNKGGGEAKIKSVVGRGFTTEYFYNKDGSIDYSKNSNGIKTVYKYNGNLINETLTDSAHGQSASSVVYLGSKSLADSSVSNEQGEHYVKTYTHDANDFIVESKDIVGGQVQNVTSSVFKDGNQVSASISDSASTKLFTIYFDYYTDKLTTITYQNFGMKFLGADSKNLIKKLVQILPTGDTVRAFSFNYHFDDKNRVTQKVMYAPNGQMVDSTSYIYY